MSVTATASSVSFNGDSVADDFPLPFRVLEPGDLLVRTTEDDETYTTLVLDDDYELADVGPDDGTGTAEGVTLTLTGGALATGTRLVIERNTSLTQETTFQPQGQFSPITVSRMPDKLTLIVQELTRRIAALEALGDLVSLEGVDAVFVATDITPTGGDIEDLFPLEVDCVGGSGARAAVLQVVDQDDNVLPITPAVQWLPGPGDKITIQKIDGLSGSDHGYTLKGMVFL